MPKSMEIKLLTYNIFCRPFPICNISNLLNGADVKTPRLNEFLKIATDRYDIICLQEIFAKGDWGRVNVIKAKSHLRYHAPAQSLGWLEVDSGLATLCNFKVLSHGFEKFTLARDEEKFVQKGIFYTKLEIGEDLHIHLLNLHFQSGPWKVIKMNQIATLNAFITQKCCDGFPVVVCGDFNIDYFSEKTLYEYLHRALEECGEMFDVVNAYFALNNRFDLTTLYGQSAINDDKGRRREMPTVGYAFDHVFFMTPKKDKKAELRAKTARLEPFFVENEKFSVLSDHSAVEVRFDVIKL